VIKNTIEPALMGSILDCDTVAECLKRIKSQFTSSSKIYATQLIKQLITEKYTGGGIREHILRMNNQASKLKPMDLALKEEFFIHLVFASLPKEYDTFVVNYNMQPKKWNLEKLMAMCAQEEDRIKVLNVGSINYLKDNKKKTLMLTPQRLRERLPCKISLSRRSLQWRKISVLTARRRGIIRKFVPIS
jgi:hypothetical protein